MSPVAATVPIRQIDRLVTAVVASLAIAGTVMWSLSITGPERRNASMADKTADRRGAFDDVETSGWAADVDTFVARLEATHPEPYHSTTREAFMAEVAAFKSALPDLSEWEARTRFMGLLAHLTREGQDGHMVLRPMDTPSVDWRVLPLEIYWFHDGFYVVAAHAESARPLVGSELVAIGGRPVGEVARLLAGVITKDNAWTVKARVPTMMLMPDVLMALGIADAASLTVMVDGEPTTVRLEPVTMNEFLRRTERMHPFIARLPYRSGHMWLSRNDESIWVRYLTRSRTLYVGFNLVRAPFDSAIAAIEELMSTKRPERVVVDLRNNPGGETGHYAPLLRALSEPPVDRPGRLYVLTGRVTFSAAANFLGVLDKDACTLVVGEPPGAAPGFWNDNDPFTLPYSGLEVGVAERWWEEAGSEHPGKVFSVDIATRMRARAYFAGRDAVLNEALIHPLGGACS